MKKLMLLSSALFAAIIANAELRALTPVPRDIHWMNKHEGKLKEIAANTNHYYDVVFVGDSITDHWENRRDCRDKGIWKHWFGYGKIKALNLGFSGDRTEHVLWRLENGELDGFRAKSVVLMIGTNNSGHFPLVEETPADTIMGVKMVMNLIRKKQPYARMIVMAIFPRGKDANDPIRKRNEMVNRELSKLCNDHDIVWMNINHCFLTADGRLSRHMMPDYLHPSVAGFDVWASAIMPVLREVCLSKDGSNTPYPKYLAPYVADSEWTDRPLEAIGDTVRITLQLKNREQGPFGEWWWLNRLHNRRLQAIAAKGKTIDVVMMGDSITHFWEWQHPGKWATFTNRYTAINCGYGGDRTQDVIWRAENGELDGFTAKAVVLMIGTNNATLGSRAEDTAEGIRECIAAIRRKQPTAKIILHPIFPRGHDTAKSRTHNERERGVNEKVNAIIKNFADGENVIWVDFNAKFLPNGWGVPPELMPDAVHPSDKGYDLWMEAINPILDRICSSNK